MDWKVLVLIAALSLSHLNAEAQTPPERRHSLTGNIKYHKDFESKTLGNKRDVWVYLPPGYEAAKDRRYPVLYMNDGQNCFDGFTSYIPNEEWKADEAAEALISSKLIEPIIIVAVSNAGAERANEYLPTKWSPEGNLPSRRAGDKGAPAYGGKADLYGQMLTGELMPFINKTYRTKTGAGNTGLAGSSFGGVVTLHLGLTKPSVFGKLGVFSPSLWWENQLMTRRVKEIKGKLAAKVWVDGGTSGDISPAEIIGLSDAFQSKGLVLGKSLATYIDGYAKHNERAWQNRFPAFLMFMYGS